MNAGEESRDGVFSKLGRVVTAPFGRGGGSDSAPAFRERAMSVRRIVDRIGVPLVGGDDVEWSSSHNAEYYGRSTAVHAAVRVLAEAVSRPPLEVWRRVGPNSEYEPAGVDHPLQRLLDRPNDVWDGGQLLRTVESRLALWGSAYVVMVRDSDGVPSEMWPLRPDEVHVVAGESDRAVRGFIHETADGRVAYLPEEMLWYRRFNPMHSFSGFSSMVPARSAVDMGDGGAALQPALLRAFGHAVGRGDDDRGQPAAGPDRSLVGDVGDAIDGSRFGASSFGVERRRGHETPGLESRGYGVHRRVAVVCRGGLPRLRRPKGVPERVRRCDAGECSDDGAVPVAEHDHPGVEDARRRHQSPSGTALRALPE